MGKSKSEIITNRMNIAIRKLLPEALTKEFGELEFSTEYNFWGGGGLITRWSDKVSKETARKIKLFIKGYESASEGYMRIASNVDIEDDDMYTAPTRKDKNG